MGLGTQHEWLMGKSTEVVRTRSLFLLTAQMCAQRLFTGKDNFSGKSGMVFQFQF